MKSGYYVRPTNSVVIPNILLETAHTIICGKSGSGKTSLLEFMMSASNRQSRVLIDPHGDLTEQMIRHSSRLKLWLVNKPGLNFNPLQLLASVHSSPVTTATLDAFRLHWPDAWGVRMEHILRNCLLTLSEYPDANLSHILKLLTDDHFRSVALQYVTNQQVLNFWHDEYDAYSKQQRSAAIAPIQNKLGALLSDPLLYRIFCEPGEQIDFRKIMDEGQTLVINLAKGKIGADSAGILGAMIVSAIGAAAFSRADIPEQERRPCTVFVDEFQNFTTLAFANMLSELRKYGVTMVLAHQYISQLKPEIREAVFGNCSTLISFRVGASDAPYLAREFAPNFDARDLMNLPNYEVIMKTLWNGRMTQAFRAKTPHPDYTAMLARNPFL